MYKDDIDYYNSIRIDAEHNKENIRDLLSTAIAASQDYRDARQKAIDHKAFFRVVGFIHEDNKFIQLPDGQLIDITNWNSGTRNGFLFLLQEFFKSKEPVDFYYKETRL